MEITTMNNMTKIALIGASVLSMGALTACQSTANTQDKNHSRMMKDHHGKPDRKMSPEQRETFEKSRAEHREVMQQIHKACDDKATGTTVQVKAGEKTIDGTCVMHFKSEHKKVDKQARQDHRPMRGEIRQGDFKRGEPLTDAQRAELTKKFDQRLAERQAHQQAVAKACQGQKDGKAVQVKVGTQTLDGKCEVRFQPKAPVQAAALTK